jgi:3-dehydroquinate synthase
MKTTKVLKGKSSYKVFSGTGSFKLLPDLLSNDGAYSNILFVVDENVMKYHFEMINSIRALIKTQNNIYVLPAGEKNKSPKQYLDILSFMAENRYGRDTLIAAIGGGVTGDITGFAASTYMRGIKVVHIPTTLLAAVDSSIGGKTGINILSRKNIIGTFYQPVFVLNDFHFLKTLPKSEIISGSGEIIKYSYLSDRDFYRDVFESYDSLISLNLTTLNKIIPACINIKAEIVTQDERESGLRKILNLGHTFAHAYESYFNFKIKHGQAVAAGIISSLFLSYQKGIINKTSLDYFLKLPSKINIPVNNTPLIKSLMNPMLSDKKNTGGRIKFILIKNIGEILIEVEAKTGELKYAVQKTYELLRS